MRVTGFVIKHALSVLLVCASLSAAAQEQKGISIGQFKLLPTIGLTYGHDENVTFANSENDVVSSDFYVVSPGIRLELPSDRSIFSLSWEGEYGRYDSSSTDDYDTWGLRGTWDFDPTSRTSMGLFGDFQDGRDRRGDVRTQGDVGLEIFDPDEYELLSIGGYFSYGAVGSRGRIEIEAVHTERDYQNNREFTQYLDRDDDYLEGTFFFRIRPKTSLLVGMGFGEISYKKPPPDRELIDSTETRFFIGLSWDVTARTSGRIDYGWLEKDFDDFTRETYDSDFWRASIDWSPRTYSTFTLSGSRETDESEGFGDYVLREDISLSWAHHWTDRFKTIVDYGFGSDDHKPDVRDDDLDYWGIGGRWQLNRYFQLGLGFHDYERDSSDQEFSYDRQTWTLTLEVSL